MDHDSDDRGGVSRRDLLRSGIYAAVVTGLTGEAEAAKRQGELAVSPQAEPESAPPDAGQEVQDSTLSARATAEWMDRSKHTPERLWGNGPPFADRPSVGPFDKHVYDGKGTLFFPGRFDNVSYDMGMINRTEKSKVVQMEEAEWTEKGLVECHRWTEDDDWRSLRNTLERHEQGVRLRLLWINTTLLKAGYKNHDARAEEIGRLVGRDGYDIVAMAEVFKSEHAETLIEEMGACRWTFDSPGDPPAKRSSRLLMMGNCDDSWRIDEKNIDQYYYQVRTNPFNHGYLRHRITVGDENEVKRGFELFSTHLQPNFKFGNVGITDVFNSEGQETKIKQLEDLVASVESKQIVRGDFPKIVMGDLNFGSDDDYGSVDASDIDHLIQNFERVNLQDAWTTHGGPAGGTIGDDVERKYVKDKPYPGGEKIPEAMCYNEEFDVGEYKQNRLDYVFVEKPKPHHGVTLDISRMWRVPFALECDDIDDDAGPYKDGEKRLIDHAGIGFELLVTPRGPGGWFDLDIRSEGVWLKGSELFGNLVGDQTLNHAFVVTNEGERYAPNVSVDVVLVTKNLYSPFSAREPFEHKWSNVSLGRISAGKTAYKELQVTLPEHVVEKIEEKKEGETVSVRLDYDLQVDGDRLGSEHATEEFSV